VRRALFPITADWARHSWERPLAAVDQIPAEGVTFALGALRFVFPPSLTEALSAAGHPVVLEQHTYSGRLRLLELGLAIACTGADESDVGRLRNAQEYEGVAAELRAAMMFVRAGARLERPRPTSGTGLCERLATFPSGEQFAVEVKLPAVGDDELDASRVQSTLMLRLIRRFSWIGSRVSEARLTFHFAPTIGMLGDRHGIDEIRMRAAVDEGVALVRLAIAQGSPFKTIALGLLGHVTIRHDAGCDAVQFDAFGPPIDPTKSSRRLTRNLLNKGARQVSPTGLPGIIVLDVNRNYSATGAIGGLARWARRKPQLAALLVTESSVMGSDGRMYGTVDVVPGPRYEAAAEMLAATLDICVDGHVHYNPLCGLPSPCPMTWRPRCAPPSHPRGPPCRPERLAAV
jgi:hypothetical protein